jgi:hypothetical protein
MPFLRGFPEARIRSQEIIEEALGYIGNDNVQALFDHIEEKGLKRSEILDKPEKFVEALERLFGKAAEIIEKQIVMEICMKSDDVQFDSNMTLVEAMYKLQV